MKKAIEIYKNENYWCDYHPMLEEFGDIITKVDEDGYQGDTWILYNDGGRYGYLQFGWGSCSGCDALQGCGSIEEVQELMDSLYESIRWFDNKNEAKQWFATHDFKGDYCWWSGDFKLFLKQIYEYFGIDEK